MTAGVDVNACPECHAADSVDLSDGVRLCLSCRTEWRPADVPADHWAANRSAEFEVGDPIDIERILNAATPAEVVDYVPDSVVLDARAAFDARALAANPADWAGMFARTASGLVVVVTVDDGTDTLVGVTSAGDEVTFFRADATYLGDVVDAAGNPVASDNEYDAGPMMPAILAVAGLCLTVGLDCVSPEEGGPLTNPRIGWLPPPCDEVPEAEQGCAYAVALLVRTFGLDHDAVRTLAANILQGARAGTETGDES